VWLSVWSKVQMIRIWSSWCHCHPVISCSCKIHNSLPLWCRLPRLSWKKGRKIDIVVVVVVRCIWHLLSLTLQYVFRWQMLWPLWSLAGTSFWWFTMQCIQRQLLWLWQDFLCVGLCGISLSRSDLAETLYQGSHTSWKILESPGFFPLKFPAPGKSWKMILVLEIKV